MDWKMVAAVIAALVLVIGFGMEAYKKWLREDRAKKGEIILVAAVLSLVLTASFAFGLEFPGLPWTYPGYAIGIFMLQWFIDQKAIKKICKVLGLFGKAKLREYGVPEKDMEVLDE
ncbi:MAG: hypothetical protein VB088_02095 [Sphaerochaeta sp.]|nr:hypothetical protein [Sphaerochaeta sp.]